MMSEDDFDDDLPQTEDEIKSWAENLKPEGSPGTVANALRKAWGDQMYEDQMERTSRASEMALDRYATVNSLLSVVTGLVALAGIIGLVGITAIVIKFIF